MVLETFRRANDFIWDRANGIVFDDVTANQGDVNGRKMRVQVVNRGAVENLTGAGLNLAWKAPNGKGLDSFKVVDAAQGIFEISFTKGMLANVGRLNASLQLILPSGEGIIESRPFFIKNQESLVDQDSAQSTDSWTALENALAGAENLEAQYMPKLFSLEQQLADKVGSGRKAELEDLSPAVLSAIEGGEGTSFNLLSIPQDKSVTPDKTTFIKQSTNLFNKNDITLGKVIGSTGEITDNSTHGYSHPIPVTPGESVYVVGVVHAAFYDNSNVFIQRINTTPAGSFIAVPNNSYIARVSFSTGTTYWRYGVVQVSKSNVPVPYETYRETLIGVDVGEEGVRNHSIPDNEVEGRKLKKGTVDGSILIDDSISEKKVRFIKKSTNLFDKTKETRNVVISTEGTEISNLDYNTSDFIAVTSSRTISTKVFYYLSFYDTNKNFLERKNVSTQSDNAQTDIPDKAVYVRGSYPHKLSNASQAQMNDGDVLLPYEEYYTELKDVKLSRQHKNSFLAEVNDATKRTIIDMPIDGVYRANTTFTGKWNYNGATTTVTVHGKYDELMNQHPDYITKEDLGLDDYGNALYLYKFKPKRPISDFAKHTPKIFLTTGIHGSEIIPPYALWLMMDEIYNNWQSDTLLEAIRFNVEFLIIPVLNPTGFEDLTRWNRNGVDLNRNFPVNWVESTPGSGGYGGTHSLSEPEARYAEDVFRSHPDIDIFVDFHNYGTNDQDGLIWITSGIPIVSFLGENLITLLTRQWRKDYGFIPAELSYFAGHVSSGQSIPTIRTYAQSLGIELSTTLETSNRISLDPLGQSLDENHIKFVVETYINWFLMNLRELVSNNKTSL